MAPVALFMSDAHLGAGPREAEAPRERALLEFLQWAGEAGGRLTVVGDLFDFWFEYRSVIHRRALPVLCALRQLQASGVEVTWMGGNHDFWLGSFLSEDLGLSIARGPLEMDLQGRRVLVVHGDGLAGRQDRGYRVLRRVIRAPLSEKLFRLVHPDLGFALAQRFSLLSRSIAESDRALLDPAFGAYVRTQFDRGFDAVVHGHHHRPVHLREQDRDWLVLGDWFHHYTYGMLRDGVFSLWRWRGRSPGEMIAPRAGFPPPGLGIIATNASGSEP